jgi:peptide/nickel transport system ATP-binding protein/oligopeptide transport system ATP-binding protein
MVMYGGQVVEQGPVREVFANPAHPYTRALLRTMPKLHGARDAKLRVIEGQPPMLAKHPSSCPFAGRCGHVHDRCKAENPARRQIGAGHDVACFWDHRSAAQPGAGA